MLLQQESPVDSFLSRYPAPNIDIPFEVRALATVEIEWHIRSIREEWEKINLDKPIVDMALAPLEEFIAHPERRITRRRLKYLMELVKEYKRSA